MKYSIKGKYPVSNLPNRIRLLDGSTRTDSSTFTSSDLSNAGITTVSDPPAYNKNTHKLTWNQTDINWEVVALTEDEIQLMVNAKWQDVRTYRSELLSKVDERILRHQSEVRLGITTHTDNISDLDNYAQALRNIPETYSNPDNIVWPTTPWVEESTINN